jgi:hypothetical protein
MITTVKRLYHAVTIAVVFATLAACQSAQRQGESAATATPTPAAAPVTPLYLCCNLRTESDWFSDGNYLVGRVFAAGTPVKMTSASRGVAYFEMDGRRYRLGHEYGTKEETFDKFVGKYFVAQDPKARIAAYPPATQNAIRAGKIARGMTKEQVILAIGYPPTHATASLDSAEWTFWYNRWVRYGVQFDAAGRVRDVNANEGIKDAVMMK